MNSINSVTFVGNLTRDAELSYTNSGFAISKMSIAINRSKKVNDSWEDETSYFDLVGLGKRFESLQQYLTRGSKVAVECHAKQERWEKDGQKRSKVVFVIDNIELVGGKSDTNQAKQVDNNSKPFPSNNGGGFEDDIPF
jgi:single-strand DNA-binding protein